MRLAILALPVFLLTSACSVKKNMDDMHKKTIQMAETTERLEESTAETKDILAWVSIVQKQGGGFDIRHTAFESMTNAETLNMKLAQAKAFYFAFDFQIASYAEVEGADLRALRDELIALNVAELGKMVPELLPEGRNRFKLNATNKDDKNLSVMALAATLHEINPLQGPQSAAVGLTPISVYDIIAEGLSKKNALDSGRASIESLSRPSREILREEQVFTFLLQLRLRALPVIALARISNVQENNFFENIGMSLFGWEPNFEEMNAEQINYASQILERALETRHLLERLGVEAKIDRKVENILKKMKSDHVRESLDSARETEKVRALDRFDRSMGNLIGRD